MAEAIRVAVSGAGGQVAYSLITRIASGEVFGPNQPVILQMLEIPEAVSRLEGLAMELEDCAFPTLAGVVCTADASEAFRNANWALLVGAFPRGPGMERKDLLDRNGKIFVGQGKAIAANAASDVRIVVVGNPCNTNCLVAYSNGRAVPAERWTALTRLDHNRARSALARKAGVPVAGVKRMTIWGNHSNTQYPDFTNTTIDGKPATEVITDREWLEKTFVPAVQSRGAAVIKARGASSALSAANATIDHVKGLLHPTPGDDWLSMATVSKGEYGVPAGLVFGYPCRSDGKGNYSVVEGVALDAYGQAMFQTTLKELLEEKEAVKELLGS